ncbi:hypothetical protein QQS21_002920 [Conoideocrella luteorostrata]|uniref:Uncharacterized protein n=1 Tax=Conoideocrella luteorostrata TaxID=1105319 RepID=A0AAJ0CV76_9HYPO|nr:hypothetical protein QQS21_002920 [Conoideocrella luteorostrata]
MPSQSPTAVRPAASTSGDETPRRGKVEPSKLSALNVQGVTLGVVTLPAVITRQFVKRTKTHLPREDVEAPEDGFQKTRKLSSSTKRDLARAISIGNAQVIFRNRPARQMKEDRTKAMDLATHNHLYGFYAASS